MRHERKTRKEGDQQERMKMKQLNKKEKKTRPKSRHKMKKSGVKEYRK